MVRWLSVQIQEPQDCWVQILALLLSNSMTMSNYLALWYLVPWFPYL